MVFGRPHPGRRNLRFADIDDMARSLPEGVTIRWRCHGCARMAPWDAAEYLARLGPTYCAHNEIGVCPDCGAPRTLHYSNGPATPYRPMKDEWLWLSREIGYGVAPEAWFEIEFMEPEPAVTSRPPRRHARGDDADAIGTAAAMRAAERKIAEAMAKADALKARQATSQPTGSVRPGTAA